MHGERLRYLTYERDVLQVKSFDKTGERIPVIVESVHALIGRL